MRQKIMRARHAGVAAGRRLAGRLVFGEKIFEVGFCETSGEAFFAENIDDRLRLSLLQFPDLFFHGARRDEAVGIDRPSLADPMGTIDRLGFDGWVPPRIVKDDVTGSGEVETCAGSAQAQEKHRGVRIGLERLDDILPLLCFSGENVSRVLPMTAFVFEQLEHLDELAEDENFLAFGDQWFEEFEQRFGFS